MRTFGTMEIVFATNNLNKLEEIRRKLGDDVTVRSLSDIGCREELPETHETLEENALEKARYVADKYRVNCFADDTGLEIESLNGRPGVYSARYAGPECRAEDNMTRVLEEMKDHTNRSACFRTIIALIMNSNHHLFEGKVNGTILEHKQGEKGFGYDPIFQPEGHAFSFAEMTMDAKNQISHRARAVEKLTAFLKELRVTNDA